MAKYDITYTCGHSGVEQLYGPGTERRKHIEWAEKNKACPDCYQAAQEKARAETAARASQANADMPTLTGTDKQIPWAETIRAKARDLLQQVVGEYESLYRTAIDAAKFTKTSEPVPTPEEVASFAARILRQSSAKYWIDHRSDLNSLWQVRNYLNKRLREEYAKAKGDAAIQGAEPW